MKDKAIIITGANGNVGSYFARKFAETGEKLYLFINKTDHRLENIRVEFPNQIEILQADISNLEEFGKTLDKGIKQRKWLPKALIHTVSVRSSDFESLVESDPALWQNIININIIGTYNVLKAILPYFRKEKYGKIILFGSNVSRIGLPRGTAYSASKAAIANISRSLAHEEAASNIIINTISPGPIKIDDSHFSESYREFRQRYYKEKIREIPLKRCASFEDLLGITRFLISEENSYITGEEFFITGGKL